MTHSTGDGGRWPFERVTGEPPSDLPDPAGGAGGAEPAGPAEPVGPAEPAGGAAAPLPTRRSAGAVRPYGPGRPVGGGAIGEGMSAGPGGPTAPDGPVVPESPAAPDGPTEPGDPGGPAEPTGPGDQAGSDAPDDGVPDKPGGPSRRDAAHRGGGGRRRPPLWLLIVIGVVVVGAIVALVLVLTRGGDDEEPLDPETVTAPVPTPTVDPIDRAEGTAFQAALPSTVLEFALTELVEHEPLLVAGAVEGYRLTYTDGTEDIVALAGQWSDAAGATAAFDQALAAADAGADPGVDADAGTETEETEDSTATEEAADTEDAAADSTEPALEREEGSVEVDGQQVGSYLFLPRADGTGTLWWTNTTVMIQLDGPAAALRDVFAAFPL